MKQDLQGSSNDEPREEPEMSRREVVRRGTKLVYVIPAVLGVVKASEVQAVSMVACW